jgi:hypothetical protein
MMTIPRLSAYWRMIFCWFSVEYCWCSVDIRTYSAARILSEPAKDDGGVDPLIPSIAATPLKAMTRSTCGAPPIAHFQACRCSGYQQSSELTETTPHPGTPLKQGRFLYDEPEATFKEMFFS